MIQPPADLAMGKAHIVSPLRCSAPRHAAPWQARGCPCCALISLITLHARLTAAPLQMHYTWGATFIAPNGTKVWEWDKRLYTELKHEQEVGVWMWEWMQG